MIRRNNETTTTTTTMDRNESSLDFLLLDVQCVKKKTILSGISQRGSVVRVTIDEQQFSSLVLFDDESEARRCFEWVKTDSRIRKKVCKIPEKVKEMTCFFPRVASYTGEMIEVDTPYFGFEIFSTSQASLAYLLEEIKSKEEVYIIYPYLGEREAFILSHDLSFPCEVSITGDPESSNVCNSNERGEKQTVDSDGDEMMETTTTTTDKEEDGDENGHPPCEKRQPQQRAVDRYKFDHIPHIRVSKSGIEEEEELLLNDENPPTEETSYTLLGCHLDLFTIFHQQKKKHIIRLIVCNFFGVDGMTGRLEPSLFLPSSLDHGGGLFFHNGKNPPSRDTLQNLINPPSLSSGEKTNDHRIVTVVFSMDDGALYPIYNDDEDDDVDQSSSDKEEKNRRNFPRERELLKAFSDWFSEINPEILVSYRLSSVVEPLLKSRMMDNGIDPSIIHRSKYCCSRLTDQRMHVDIQKYLHSNKILPQGHSWKELVTLASSLSNRSTASPSLSQILSTSFDSSKGRNPLKPKNLWSNPMFNYELLCGTDSVDPVDQISRLKLSLLVSFHCCYQILLDSQHLSLCVSLARACHSPMEHVFRNAPILRYQWCTAKCLYDHGGVVIPPADSPVTFRDVSTNDGIFRYPPGRRRFLGKRQQSSSSSSTTTTSGTENNNDQDKTTPSTQPPHHQHYQGGYKRLFDGFRGYTSMLVCENDLKSQYPKAIIQENIGFSEGDRTGILKNLMIETIQKRDQHTLRTRSPGDRHSIASKVYKLKANTTYGCIGSKFFRFRSIQSAGKVCESSRNHLVRSIGKIEELQQVPAYCDTDGIFWTHSKPPSGESPPSSVNVSHSPTDEESFDETAQKVLQYINGDPRYPEYQFKQEAIYQSMFISSPANMILLPRGVSVHDEDLPSRWISKGFFNSRSIPQALKRICESVIVIIFRWKFSSDDRSSREGLCQDILNYLQTEKKLFHTRPISDFQVFVECKVDFDELYNINQSRRHISSLNEAPITTKLNNSITLLNSKEFFNQPHHRVAFEASVKYGIYPLMEGDLIPMVHCLNEELYHPSVVKRYGHLSIDHKYYWCNGVSSILLKRIFVGNLSFISEFIQYRDVFNDFRIPL